MGARTAEQQREYHWANRERINARRREHRAANKERLEAYLRSWREANPDRVKLYRQVMRAKRRKAYLGGDLTVAEWAQIVDSFAGRCAYCDEVATDLEHVIPLCRGGKHTASNVLPACAGCNSQKYKMTLEEWLDLPGCRATMVCGLL